MSTTTHAGRAAVSDGYTDGYVHLTVDADDSSGVASELLCNPEDLPDIIAAAQRFLWERADAMR